RRGGQVPAARRGDRMTTVAAVLVLAGALLAFVGSLGLLRMKTFFERVHPPTMGTTLGTAFVLAGSMLYFTALESRLVLHEILIGVFMMLSTPVTYVLLGRAALRRERKAPDA
ncbi:MAG TPA: monovalent cation/H(+) antiporter subunit G, partial [Burkholderiales bacterium]|nr:monovalent cation/H(+) antiporter subunit G [Burkholderiales bacterium]